VTPADETLYGEPGASADLGDGRVAFDEPLAPIGDEDREPHDEEWQGDHQEHDGHDGDDERSQDRVRRSGMSSDRHG